MTPLTRRLLRLGAPAALVAAGALSSAALAHDDAADPPETDASGLEAERQRVQDEQARVAGEVDLLVASEAEVAAALAVLDRALVEQQAALAAAREAAAAAKAQLDEAVRLEREAEAAVDAAQRRLHDLAISAYVRPPDDALIPAVAGGTVVEAPVRIVYAEVRARQLQDAIDAITATERELARRRRAQEAAQQAAAAAEAEAAAKLGELEAARAAQADAAQQVADRLERALSESAALVGLDAQLAEEIAQRQAVLAAAAADAQRAAAAAAAEAAVPPAEVPPAPGGDGPAPGPTAVVEAPPPPPPPPAPRPLPVPVETTWVGGIEVAVEIAAQVRALLDAAAADGLELTGSGYRNIEDQIRIRSEVCGPTDYDIWEKPSWECVPPVARPGRSMHEKGLAIDFTGPNGDLVRTRDSPTFQWLAANAARFGLYNLPVEPWHWSTTGT